jgi:hypothetical protein
MKRKRLSGAGYSYLASRGALFSFEALISYWYSGIGRVQGLEILWPIFLLIILCNYPLTAGRDFIFYSKLCQAKYIWDAYNFPAIPHTNPKVKNSSLPDPDIPTRQRINLDFS